MPVVFNNLLNFQLELHFLEGYFLKMGESTALSYTFLPPFLPPPSFPPFSGSPPPPPPLTPFIFCSNPLIFPTNIVFILMLNETIIYKTNTHFSNK